VPHPRRRRGWDSNWPAGCRGTTFGALQSLLAIPFEARGVHPELRSPRRINANLAAVLRVHQAKETLAFRDAQLAKAAARRKK